MHTAQLCTAWCKQSNSRMDFSSQTDTLKMLSKYLNLCFCCGNVLAFEFTWNLPGKTRQYKHIISDVCSEVIEIANGRLREKYPKYRRDFDYKKMSNFRTHFNKLLSSFIARNRFCTLKFWEKLGKFGIGSNEVFWTKQLTHFAWKLSPYCRWMRTMHLICIEYSWSRNSTWSFQQLGKHYLHIPAQYWL